MIVTPTQNTTELGYGSKADPTSQRTRLLRLFAEIYDAPGGVFLTYAEAEEQHKGGDKRWLQIRSEGQSGLLDTLLFSNRCQIMLRCCSWRRIVRAPRRTN